jgi:hypothetical protein
MVIGIVVIVITLVTAFGDEKWPAIPLFLVAVLCFWGSFWGQIHRLVKPNEVLLVIDRKTGQIIEPLRTSGITGVPLWTIKTYPYPAQTVYQWCPQFTPSSKGGASLITVVCFTADASQIDWIAQFKAFNGDEMTVRVGWQNAVQTSVARAISGFNPRDLTDRRADVETEIYNQTIAWFTESGIPITMVGLKNWQFASEDANTAYDEALLSQTQIDVANSQQEAARIRADTQVIVAQKLADGQRLACQTAGMISETTCLEYLQLIWLSSSQNQMNIVVVTGSDGNVPVAIPSMPSANPTVVPTAVP